MYTKNPVKRYFINVGLAIDQLMNAIAGGDPDETISSRVGKIRRNHAGVIPWTRPLAKLIDAVCELFDDNHTLESIDEEEGHNTVIDKDYF